MESYEMTTDELQANAATQVVEAENKAIDEVLTEQRKNKEDPHAYTVKSSMLPLTNARLAYEGFFSAYVKEPHIWGQATALPWLAAFPQPNDWHLKRAKLDANGNRQYDANGKLLEEYVNEIRRLHFPNAAFVSKARYDQYEAAMLETEEPIWLCLWSINVRKCRWKDKDVEAIIAQDKFWNSRYNLDLPPLDEEDEDEGSRANACSSRIRMLPLSRGRLIYESWYNSYVKPHYLWSQVTDAPHLPGYPQPNNWHLKRAKLDANGNRQYDANGKLLEEYVNEIRRLHFPNAAFVSKARYDQYEAAMLETEEPIWLCLWSINVRKCRWKDKDVEAIIAQDKFWNSRYNTDLPLLDEEEDEGDGGQSGILSARGDGGTPPSSPGLANVEA